ncbi:hypothetical protein JTE90_003381 [Oedothorax gibbosus]|uniref:Uncharacterized protein n=1 Tax=Oedothorax gibbosus TaxID=931172 RepID=A0AAV6TZK4_9ARAC|nr:hypothetical protein JTE90_003381 [Oedothorax gibbosus]
MCPATGRRKMNPRRSRAAPTNRVETVERSGGEGAAVPCREERRSGEREDLYQDEALSNSSIEDALNPEESSDLSEDDEDNEDALNPEGSSDSSEDEGY